VRALVLVDTEAEVYSDEDRAQFQGLFDAAMAVGLSGEVGDVLAMTLFAPGYADARYWRGKWTAKPISAWLGAKECLFERDDILGRLSEITCPSIVFHGDADMAIPVERGQRVSDTLAGPSSFVLVPGAGHSANLEVPDVVNPAMLDFLASLD
jgi:pimeloyl-ACP methyl ester carboxylesterase